MSQQELDEIRASMGECERLEALLEAAKGRRTQLATRLYAQNGHTRTYQLPEIPGVCDAVELLVSRTKPRRDGTVSYFFAEKQRWRGAQSVPRVEANPEGLLHDRIHPASGRLLAAAPIPLTGRLVEATANLTGRSAAGDEPVTAFTEDDFKARRITGRHAGRLLSELCSVCGEPQFSTFHGDTCPNGHGGAPSLAYDPLERIELTEEELSSVYVLSQAEIEAAAEQGRRDSEAIRASRGGLRLPIVGEGRPEPRLLQIQEATGFELMLAEKGDFHQQGGQVDLSGLKPESSDEWTVSDAEKEQGEALMQGDFDQLHSEAATESGRLDSLAARAAALLDSAPKDEPEEVDPDQAILDELLADM
jgi:hypothetical protein